MAETNRTSPWVWVGCGCGLALLILVGAVCAFMFVGYRWVKSVETTLEDPAARTAKAKEVLGCQELPEGYWAMMALGVPFVMDIAVLSSGPEPVGRPESFGERGFIFFEMRRMGDVEQQLTDYIEGRTEKRPDVFVQSDIQIDTHEVVRRGALDLDGAGLRYAVYRGGVEVDHAGADGLATMMLFDCPDNARIRYGIWFGPEPETGGDADPWAGSTADENEMRAFLSHFDVCG